MTWRMLFGGTALLGFWLPAGIGALALLGPRLGLASWVHGEFGLIENGTVLLLLLATALSVQALRDLPPGAPQRPLRILMALVLAAGTFFFAGEELSWGQHWLGFQTPEALVEGNWQEEVNLHNSRHEWVYALTHKWPYLALSWGCPVLGFGLPFLLTLARVSPRPTEALYWISPGLELGFTGLAVPWITLPDHLGAYLYDNSKYFREHWGFHKGEAKECLMACFLFAYALRLYQKHRAERDAAGRGSSRS